MAAERERLIVKMTSFSNPNCQCSTSVKPPRDLTPGHLGKPGGLWTSGWQVKILKPPASRGILSACTCLHNADKRLVQLFKCISADVWKLGPVSYLMPGLIVVWGVCAWCFWIFTPCEEGLDDASSELCLFVCLEGSRVWREQREQKVRFQISLHDGFTSPSQHIQSLTARHDGDSPHGYKIRQDEASGWSNVEIYMNSKMREDLCHLSKNKNDFFFIL